MKPTVACVGLILRQRINWCVYLTFRWPPCSFGLLFYKKNRAMGRWLEWIADRERAHLYSCWPFAMFYYKRIRIGTCINWYKTPPIRPECAMTGPVELFIFYWYHRESWREPLFGDHLRFSRHNCMDAQLLWKLSASDSHRKWFTHIENFLNLWAYRQFPRYVWRS